MIDFKKLNEKHNGSVINYKSHMPDTLDEKEAEIKRLKQYILDQNLHFQKYQKIMEIECEKLRDRIENLEYELKEI